MSYLVELFHNHNNIEPIQSATSLNIGTLVHNQCLNDNNDIIDPDEVVAEFMASGDTRQEFSTENPDYTLKITKQ